jgi:hypothetical protein
VAYFQVYPDARHHPHQELAAGTAATNYVELPAQVRRKTPETRTLVRVPSFLRRPRIRQPYSVRRPCSTQCSGLAERPF